MSTRALLLFLLGFHLLQAQSWNQMTKVSAPDRSDGAVFSLGMEINGDYAIIGAYQDDLDEDGLNPVMDAGSAYIYRREGCTWVLMQKIVASSRVQEDYFGYDVAINGEFALVTANLDDDDANGGNFQSNAGAVYVFKNINGTWTEVQKLVASDRNAEDNFGLTLALSGDYAVISAYLEDEDAAGMNTLLSAGSAYIFKNTNGVWAQVQKIVASDRAGGDNFGISTDIDGNYLVVGAYFEDEDASGMNFLTAAGSAYIFKNTGGVWSQVKKIVNADRAANDRFGWSVAVSGDFVMCGAPNEDDDENGMNFMSGAGSAYIFQSQSDTWPQVKKVVAQHRAALDQFGFYIAMDGEYALIANFREDFDCNGLNALANAGSAYMYKNTTGTWSLYQKICRTDRAEGDFFAIRVALSGDYALVSSHLDDEDALGMNTMNNSGSAYFFKFGTCAPPTAVCGAITVYVDPNSPVYDGPGTSNIWWIAEDDLDAGSSSSSQNHTLAVRRHLSQIPFDWTTQGACIDVTLNGSVNNNDKGIVYRDCIPVRNADFNSWKLYQLRAQDQWGTSTCYGTVKVVPMAPVHSTAPVVHVIYTPEVNQTKSETEYLDGLLRDAERFDGIVPSDVPEFNIYPNPGHDVLQLTWHAIAAETMTISVADLAGRLVSSNEYEVLSGTNHVMIDMSAQAKGVYVVHIKSDSLQETKKWMKIGE